MPERQDFDEAAFPYLTRLAVLHDDVTEIKMALRGLAEAVTKLALVEERQMNVQQQVGRLFKVVEDRIEPRIARLELTVNQNSRSAVWIDRAIYALLGILLMYAAKKVGML